MIKMVKEHLFEYHEAIQSQSANEKRGAHYKAKLEEIVDMANELYSELPEGSLPAWVGDKIVVAKEYLYAVKSWLHGEEEESEGEELGYNRKMDHKEEHLDNEWNNKWRNAPPVPNPDGGSKYDNQDWRGHEMGQQFMKINMKK